MEDLTAAPGDAGPPNPTPDPDTKVPQADRNAYRRVAESDLGLSDLEALVRLCHVPRWVTVPLLRPQSVAEHSFRVAIIAMAILRSMGKLPEMSITCMSAILHERAEALTGDIPAPNKKGSATDLGGGPDQPHSLGEYVLKLADLIEAFSYLGSYGLDTTRKQEILDNYREAIQGQMRTMQDKFTQVGEIATLPLLVDEVLEALREAR